MFGMLKRGFRPAAKPAAKPAAEPVRKVAPKGKTKTVRVFEDDPTDPLKKVGTDKVYVIDEEGSVFHRAGDEKNPKYTAKDVDLTPSVEYHKRTGEVIKTTTYTSPENKLAAMYKEKGGQLREETGSFQTGSLRSSTWAGKEYGKPVNWRSKEDTQKRSKLASDLVAMRKSGEFRDYLMENPGRRGAFLPPSQPTKPAYFQDGFHVRRGSDGNWYRAGTEPVDPPPTAQTVNPPRKKVRPAKSNLFSRHASNTGSANPNIGPQPQPQPKPQAATPPPAPPPTQTAKGAGAANIFQIKNAVTQQYIQDNKDDLKNEGLIDEDSNGVIHATSKPNRSTLNKRASAAANAAKVKPKVQPAAAATAAGTGKRGKRNVGAKVQQGKS